MEPLCGHDEKVTAIFARWRCAALMLVVACSGKHHPGPTESADPPACALGPAWSPGQPAFTEVTTQWGLAEIGVEGVQMTATDIDGDGWTDVVVRRGDSGIDEFSPGGHRSTWVLHNEAGRRFVDVTESSGLTAPRGGAPSRPVTVVVWADVDNDGDLDVYTGTDTSNAKTARGETSELLINDGRGVFTLGPVASPLRRVGRADAPGGASFVDVDRDGFVDLWVPQYNAKGGDPMQARLWRGDGSGSFADMTVAAGLTSEAWGDIATLNRARAHVRAWSAAACDLDGDGNPELLASSYGRSPNHLWRADRRGHYINRSIDSGYAFDDDQGWSDNAYARCYCQEHRDAADCQGVPEPRLPCPFENWRHEQDREPFRLGGNSGTTVCSDIDNDGDLDLLTTEIKHWWGGSGSDGGEILVNRGDATFSRPGNATTGLAKDHSGAPFEEGKSFDYTGWHEGTITATVLDFDNNGRQDIYLGDSEYLRTRGRLFHQEAPLSFRELSVEDFFEHNRSHGVAVADFDRDGDVDIIVGHSHSRCRADQPNPCYPTQAVRLFRNDVGNSQAYLQLRLEGAAGSNRAAIGARVTVTAGNLVQTSEVGGGFGHYGMQNDLVQHFGLGKSCTARVTVRWPDAAGTTQTFEARAGHRYHVVQGHTPVVDDAMR